MLLAMLDVGLCHKQPIIPSFLYLGCRHCYELSKFWEKLTAISS